MAFRYTECEFCANHGNHDLCDDCEDGDAFEDIEDRKRSKKEPKFVNGSKVTLVDGRETIKGMFEAPMINSIMKRMSE